MMQAIDIQRRRFICVLPLAGLAVPQLLRAQLRVELQRIVHGYPVGGSVDIVCRKLADKLAGRYAGHAIVDSKPGAAGRLAIEELRRARADGSVLLVTPASTLTLYPHVYRQLGHDVFADLAPVSTVVSSGFALAVGPRVPAMVDSFDSFRQWCRAEPAVAQCGNAGAGSLPHFMAMLMAREAGTALAHIPYRGGSAAMQAAAAGEVAAALSTEAAARPLQQAGRLRVLASTWAGHSPFFPLAPSFQDLGLPLLVQQEWFGAFMPARTPDAAVQAVAAVLREALSEPDVRELWEKTFLGVDSSGPAQLRVLVRREHDFWARAVRASGFTPEG